jgi:hypothetical protein
MFVLAAASPQSQHVVIFPPIVADQARDHGWLRFNEWYESGLWWWRVPHSSSLGPIEGVCRVTLRLFEGYATSVDTRTVCIRHLCQVGNMQVVSRNTIAGFRDYVGHNSLRT